MLRVRQRFIGSFTFPAIAMIAAVAAVPDSAFATTVTLTPIKDNTLIESLSGANSNGASEGIFSGRLGSMGGGLKLRAVLAFNLSSIPAGSTIINASLTLTIAQAVGGNQTHGLYKLLADWGEGTSYEIGGLGSASTPNDATWIHTFYPDSYWSAAGGDYVATSSATKLVGNSGVYTWTSAGLIADVQSWVNTPGTNFGWIIKGNESILKTAKKFVSKEGEAIDRPKLAITYTLPPPPCQADIVHNSAVDVNDLVAVINAWGPCPAPPASCAADVAPAGGNGQVNVDDLLAVINGWGACP